MRWRLGVLGPPALEAKGGGTADLSLGKPLAVLIYLAHQEGGVERSDLGRLLWRDSTDRAARTSVRQALYLLRKGLAWEAVDLDDPVELPAGLVELDRPGFEAALAAGNLDEAMALWRGPFLDRFSVPGAPLWDRWVEEQRSRLEHRFGSVLYEAGKRAREVGDAGEACRLLEKAVEVQPDRIQHHLERIGVLLDLHRLEAAEDAITAAWSYAEEVPERERLRRAEAQLQSLRLGMPELESAAGLRPAFAGRAREYADLVGLWRQTEEGVLRAAIVSGPAGVGKSRLAGELAARVRAEGGPVVWVEGLDAERPIRGELLADLVAALLPLPGSAGTSEAADAALRSLVPSQAREVGNGLADAALLTDALQDLIGAVTYEQPLLVVVDDVQWADPYSRSVLARVVRRSRGSSCLFVFVTRSGHGDVSLRKTLDAIRQVDGALEVELGPLTRGELTELLILNTDTAAPEAVEELAGQLYAVTRGNPLFLVELLRGFQQAGALEASDPGEPWTIHFDRLGSELLLARSVRDVIGRRLDGLPADAARVASQLAAEGRPSTVESLERALGLESSELARAVAELFRRQLVVWGEGEALAFAHDEIRASVAARWPARPGSRSRPRWRRWATTAAAVALVAVLAAAAVVAGGLDGPGPEPPPPYGGGTLWLWNGDAPLGLRPAADAEAGWREVPVEWAPPLRRNWWLDGPYRGVDGKPLWYGVVMPAAENPYVVRATPDTVAVVARRPSEDAYPVGISPDGRHIAYVMGNPDTPGYDLDLYIARADGSEPRVILEGRRLRGRGGWSPDGRHLVVDIHAAMDTLAVINPLGERVLSLLFYRFDAAWCGGSRTLAAGVMDPDGGRRIVRIDVPSGEVREVEAVGTVLDLRVECSPDGSAVAYHTAIDGQRRIAVQPLESGSATVIPAASGDRNILNWMPDSLPFVPTAARVLGPDSVLLEWGARRPMAVEVAYSDGSRRTEAVEWRSRDESVVSVLTTDSGAVLTANRPGAAVVVATAGGWHRDSVHVRVTGSGTGDALLRDRFVVLDSTRWATNGWPTPVPVERAGEPVLWLRSDGIYSEGIISREGFPLPGGGTLEAEIRMPVDRPAGQWFNLSLNAYEHPPGADGGLPPVRSGGTVGFGYPYGEGPKFRADRATLGSRVIDVSEVFPTDDWVHVALQMRADGTVSLFLDRQHVADWPLRLANRLGTRWYVRVEATVEGTEALLRNLVLYPGMRYDQD